MKLRLPAKLKPFDVPAVLLAAAITAGAAFWVYGGASGEAKVIIESGDKTWVYPLDAEETIAVPGALGTTVVHIHDGAAAVESSPCENQTCVAAGSIHLNGQWVACLPNAVFVRIEGSAIDEVPDATSR
jgi:hypothetical protein